MTNPLARRIKGTTPKECPVCQAVVAVLDMHCKSPACDVWVCQRCFSTGVVDTSRFIDKRPPKKR